ncbi:hypothetical protein [Escherichia phage vB-Eco-KMB37]|nr:hypothetical protein [Escherichia phage vB-Eco-KMB37]
MSRGRGTTTINKRRAQCRTGKGEDLHNPPSQ